MLLVRDKSGALGGAKTGALHPSKKGLIQDAKGLTLQGWTPLPKGGATGSPAPTMGGTGGTSSSVSTETSRAGTLGAGTTGVTADQTTQAASLPPPSPSTRTAY
ncbi:MAG: hypothetical protein LBJ70_04640 [Holosporales bacterium]|nr:hypothetical protein [Holosporales bacterium]